MSTRTNPPMREKIPARLREIAELYETMAQGPRTGRVIRGEHDEVVGRGRGYKDSFPEMQGIPESPGRIVAAIRRGEGRLFQAVKARVKRFLAEQYHYSRGRVVSPHDSITGRCKTCGDIHKASKHRAHGHGAFERTHPGHVSHALDWEYGENMPKRAQKKYFEVRGDHGRLISTHGTEAQAMRAVQDLFDRWKVSRDGRAGVPFPYHVQPVEPRTLGFSSLFNRRAAPRRPARRRAPVSRRPRRNPPMRLIYGKVLEVICRRTGVHECDAECKRVDHTYKHTFRAPYPALYGSGDKKTLVIR